MSRRVGAKAACRKMLALSGMTMVEVSRRMHRNDAYVAGMLYHDGTPNMTSFLRMVEACGAKVYVAYPDGSIDWLEPPETER